jgi:hypothetical protein
VNESYGKEKQWVESSAPASEMSLGLPDAGYSRGEQQQKSEVHTQYEQITECIL